MKRLEGKTAWVTGAGSGIGRAAALLAKAERPIIVVGGGAQDASAEVTALAELPEAAKLDWR